MVRLAPPPPVHAPRPVFSHIASGTMLVRVYNPARFDARPLAFRDVGPINRFDHHRSSAPARCIDVRQGLWQDRDRSVAYFGRTLSCCLAEVFGDTGTIEREPWEMALIELRHSLTLLDLRDGAAMRAGTVEAIAKTDDRRLSQAWARYFYETETLFDTVAGLHFHGAHNGEECYAFFERALPALYTERQWIRPLAARGLDEDIERVALALNLLVA